MIKKMILFDLLKLLIWFTLTRNILSTSECPWQSSGVPDPLQSSCHCSYSLGHHELSVQCDMVNWLKFKTVLNTANETALNLLYVNNSTIGSVEDNLFVNLNINNIQLSGCNIRKLGNDAFHGQEQNLRILNLQDNELNSIPMNSLKSLKNLQLLDLSHNRITAIGNGTFKSLTKLSTLKLSDNNLTLESGAFKGLEKCLKNLNLKGTRQTKVPQSIQGMKTLAFLDLSQNSIKELSSDVFADLDSLTALNLERNILQKIKDTAFSGIKNSLNSLSLLNNLLPDFPTSALSSLKELKVLDIGFNLLTELPENAFNGNPSITLLAVDGNPLSTIPYQTLARLNKTLRGLSLGGRFLNCDCQLLTWVLHSIREYDLQVTSRERNPQFCGSPPKFRDKNFYSIQLEDTGCTNGITTIGNSNKTNIELTTSKVINSPAAVTVTSITSTKSQATSTTTPKITSTSSTTHSSTTTRTTTNSTTKIRQKPPTFQKTNERLITMTNNKVHNGLLAAKTKIENDVNHRIIVKNAYREDNFIDIQWDVKRDDSIVSSANNILGFQLIYRLFGSKTFKKHGPPLEGSERKYKFRDIWSQEYIVVCIVSLEDDSINTSSENILVKQCREIKPVSASISSNMDKIIIAASAAICSTIVIAVIIFVAASRIPSRSSNKFKEKHIQKLHHGIPVSGLPINCCNLPVSPTEPLSSLGALNMYHNGKEWDQVSSSYSMHSQRPSRLCNVESTALSSSLDDMLLRSAQFEKKKRARSVADGQSQNSFSTQHSGRNLGSTYNMFSNTNLVAQRQDFPQSRRRQSMVIQSNSDGARIPPYTIEGHRTDSLNSSTKRSTSSKSRPRSYQQYPNSRYSIAESILASNNYSKNYCNSNSFDNNWTDHDMDIYMARNPTAT